jgi:hypothetical protein
VDGEVGQFILLASLVFPGWRGAVKQPPQQQKK